MGSIANRTVPVEAESENGIKQTTLVGMGSVWFAIAQAACATSVFLKGVAVLLGVSVVSAAAALEFLHQPLARVILVTFALTGAGANLYVVWTTWKLRRNPAARWRLRPLTTSERRRMVIAISTSVLTFVVLAVEVWAHLLLHPLHLHMH